MATELWAQRGEDKQILDSPLQSLLVTAVWIVCYAVDQLNNYPCQSSGLQSDALIMNLTFSWVKLSICSSEFQIKYKSQLMQIVCDNVKSNLSFLDRKNKIK